MNFKIILLLSIIGMYEICGLEIKALKRIKRNSDLKTHNRIKQDFVLLHNKNHNPIDASDHQDVSDLQAELKTSKNFTSDGDKKRNVNRSLADILRERERKFNERVRADRKVADDASSNSDSKAINHGQESNVDNANHLVEKHYSDDGNSREICKARKFKRLPHVLHSAGVVETKVVVPQQPVRSGYRGLNPFSSLEQLMNIGNMMMFKVGMDTLPYSPHSSKMIMTQNGPYLSEKQSLYQPSNDPSLDYIFNSIDGPQENYFNFKSPLQYNSPNMDGNLQTHTIIYKPLVSVKEPTPLANLMRSALDTLLANSDEVDGDKNENEIEFSCPVHHEKKSVIEGNENSDLIQVCSCRFIKKAKENDNKNQK